MRSKAHRLDTSVEKRHEKDAARDKDGFDPLPNALSLRRMLTSCHAFGSSCRRVRARAFALLLRVAKCTIVFVVALRPIQRNIRDTREDAKTRPYVGSRSNVIRQTNRGGSRFDPLILDEMRSGSRYIGAEFLLG